MAGKSTSTVFVPGTTTENNITALQTKTQNLDSVSNQTGVNGNLTVYGTNGVIAQKFFMVGGVSGEFLKANGTVDSNSYISYNPLYNINYGGRKFSLLSDVVYNGVFTSANLLTTISPSIASSAVSAGEAKIGDTYIL